ncbi:MAG: hypothetical protein LBT11_05355 [Treponema sp.]|jgi:hypothetical protein|nr:hypothetical protein [Treponema sp.]
MRIAIVSAPAQRKVPPDYVLSLAKGMESMGHRVEVIDAWTEAGVRLPGFDYVVAVAESTSLIGGKLPGALSRVLSVGSSLVGKKGAAFLKKKGPFTGKAMANLMRAMEKEGMIVNWSDIILNAPHAEALGKRIGA